MRYSILKSNDDDNNNNNYYVCVQLCSKLNRTKYYLENLRNFKMSFKIDIDPWRNTNGFRGVWDIRMGQHFPYLPISKIIFIYNIVICMYWSVCVEVECLIAISNNRNNRNPYWNIDGYDKFY